MHEGHLACVEYSPALGRHTRNSPQQVGLKSGYALLSNAPYVVLSRQVQLPLSILDLARVGDHVGQVASVVVTLFRMVLAHRGRTVRGLIEVQ